VHESSDSGVSIRKGWQHEAHVFRRLAVALVPRLGQQVDGVFGGERRSGHGEAARGYALITRPIHTCLGDFNRPGKLAV
jgi:hypothetical protein